MAGNDHTKEFPDVDQKLSAPKKLSAFEKERQAAEAKRIRAEEENAAALRAFEDTFGEQDDDPLSGALGGRGPPAGPRGGGRYGMPPSGPRSGPGSLDSGFGMGPPSLKRKRALDEMREAQEARRDQGMLGYADGRHSRHTPQDDALDDDRADLASLHTIQLSGLPPNMTSEKVNALLKNHLKVHSVHFQPPARPGTAGKRTLTAIATLASETSTGQIDTAVTALKDRYLGCGYHLSISRHLSSTALHPAMAASTASASTEPFGAEKPREMYPRHSMRNAPPPRDLRGFAPPGSYDGPPNRRYEMPNQPEALVNVRVPQDIGIVRAIHILVERLKRQPSRFRAMQFEALLMAMPDVQQDERFSFLYDSRSTAGVYYRWLLWRPKNVSERERRAGPVRIFKDQPMWAPPKDPAQFMDVMSLGEVIDNIDYVSSDEESDDKDARRRFNQGHEGEAPPAEAHEKNYLNPVKRARLVHLLARLPTTNAKLRKGDVARITSFAINHAGAGAEEIVDLLLLNVDKPLVYTSAAKDQGSDSEQGEEDDYEPNEALPTLDTDSPKPQREGGKREQDDPSNARLIALYVISDVLSASSTAGAKNAWKYRQLFESGFKALKTFETLGRLDKELSWGRLKAEQWKRKVGVIFGIWEGWSVFSSDVHEELKRSFFEPPLTEEEKRAEAQVREREEKLKKEEKVMAKFKRVGGADSASASPAPSAPAVQASEEVDGRPLDDLDGMPMVDDVDGAPMTDDVDGAPVEDMDGQPMEEVDGAPMADDGMPMSLDAGVEKKPKVGTAPPPASSTPKPSGPKRRMRAEDMFASDEE